MLSSYFSQVIHHVCKWWLKLYYTLHLLLLCEVIRHGSLSETDTVPLVRLTAILNDTVSDIIPVFLQEEIVLVGHSAGAHLCVMAVLELIMKRLIHTPLPPLAQSVGASISESIRFEDRHFDGSSSENGAFGASSGEVSNGENVATGVNSGGGDVRLEPASTTTSFIFVEGQEQRNTDLFCVVDKGNSAPVSAGHSGSGDETPDGASGSIPSGQVEGDLPEQVEAGSEVDADESSTAEGTDPLLAVRTERLLSQSQRQLKDLLNSVKAVIGAFAILF